ncbi:hypothetical protein H6F42_15885 [Pseudanabaena sp. FACHB-1998]|nr:hypothetical protein [Pseudanabaena sp. FACHB-1998]
MQTTERIKPEIGKHYPTALIWVSRNGYGYRYTYCSDDCTCTGHFTEPDQRKFRRALALEIFCLQLKGYFTRIKHTTIEG